MLLNLYKYFLLIEIIKIVDFLTLVARSSPSKSKSLSVPGDAAEANKKGSASPKLKSYRGTADKCKFEGETVRHFNAGKLAVFELKAPGHKREDVEVSIISKKIRLFLIL